MPGDQAANTHADRHADTHGHGHAHTFGHAVTNAHIHKHGNTQPHPFANIHPYSHGHAIGNRDSAASVTYEYTRVAYSYIAASHEHDDGYAIINRDRHFHRHHDFYPDADCHSHLCHVHQSG